MILVVHCTFHLLEYRKIENLRGQKNQRSGTGGKTRFIQKKKKSIINSYQDTLKESADGTRRSSSSSEHETATATADRVRGADDDDVGRRKRIDEQQLVISKTLCNYTKRALFPSARIKTHSSKFLHPLPARNQAPRKHCKNNNNISFGYSCISRISVEHFVRDAAVGLSKETFYFFYYLYIFRDVSVPVPTYTSKQIAFYASSITIIIISVYTPYRP